MTRLLSERYRPQTLSEIKGNGKAVKEIKQWAEKWQEGERQNPLLLHGEPGTGKTSTAMALSNDFGWPLAQFNASDTRRSDEIARIARQIQVQPPTADYQLVLLDEVDNLYGRADAEPLKAVLRNPTNPILCTANEHWNVPDWLTRYAKKKKFNLQKRSRRNHIKEIVEKEGFDLDKQDIDKLAGRPDLRSAINDLQMWADADIPPDTDGRDWDTNRFAAIRMLLQCDSRWKDVMSPSDGAFTPPEAIQWAAENVSSQWRGLEAAVAYNALSYADVCCGMAEQSQDYRFWKYATAHLEKVPDTRLTEPYMGYINIDHPTWYGSKKASPKSDTPEARLYRKLKGDWGFRFAGSYYEFRNDILPTLQDMSDDEKKELALDYDLDTEEMSVLGITKAEFDDWAIPGEPKEGEGYVPPTNSVTDW